MMPLAMLFRDPARVPPAELVPMVENLQATLLELGVCPPLAEAPLTLGNACRVCGCTDMDCTGCVERTGEVCFWVEHDLCSACVGEVY